MSVYVHTMQDGHLTICEANQADVTSSLEFALNMPRRISYCYIVMESSNTFMENGIKRLCKHFKAMHIRVCSKSL